MEYLELKEPGASVALLVQKVERRKSKFGEDYALIGNVEPNRPASVCWTAVRRKKPTSSSRRSPRACSSRSIRASCLAVTCIAAIPTTSPGPSN